MFRTNYLESQAYYYFIFHAKFKFNVEYKGLHALANELTDLITPKHSYKSQIIGSLKDSSDSVNAT